MSTVIRSPNWIGDGIMSLPAIRAFKKYFPDERLVVAAKRYLADIFLNIPEIDEIIPLPDRWTPRSFFSSLREFRRRSFDRGILFTNSFSSALFFRLAGIGSSAGYSRDGRGWLLRERVPRGADRGHQQYDYLQIIEHLAGKSIIPASSPPPWSSPPRKAPGRTPGCGSRGSPVAFPCWPSPPVRLTAAPRPGRPTASAS